MIPHGSLTLSLPFLFINFYPVLLRYSLWIMISSVINITKPKFDLLVILIILATSMVGGSSATHAQLLYTYNVVLCQCDQIRLLKQCRRLCSGLEYAANQVMIIMHACITLH